MEFVKWNWSNNGHFSNFFFFGHIDQENVFYHILERKHAFLGYKNKKFKKSKNLIFPKGLTHGFGPKMPIIPIFSFLGNMGQENIFYDILFYEKKPFQALKTRSSKRRKIDIFPKGLTYGFNPKIAISPTFFLGKIGQENVFYEIVERKNTFLGQKTRTSKRRKIDIFPRGLTHGFGPKSPIFPSFFLSAIQHRKLFLTIFQNEKTPFQANKKKKYKKIEKLTFFQRG